MMFVDEYRLGADRILTCMIPQYQQWVSSILKELKAASDQFEFSHQISGRWENSYLEVDLVPSVRTAMRLARDMAKKKLSKSTLALYEALPNMHNPHPPFWFNIAKVGELTGVHDHAQFSSISGVVYLKSNLLSGDLYFQKEGEDDLLIIPEVGKMVLFPSHLKHGVHPNKSDDERISLAFNLYPFPLPSSEW
jgi:hypothetical protein